jgi:hypothetical protein
MSSTKQRICDHLGILDQECQLILFCLNKYRFARGKVHHFRYAALENYFDGDEAVKILMIQVELDDTRQNLSVE